MQLKVKIKLGNDAMLTHHDLAEALYKLADALLDGGSDVIHPKTSMSSNLLDRNGQSVGEWSLR
jgi:hypothetical protein